MRRWSPYVWFAALTVVAAPVLRAQGAGNPAGITRRVSPKLAPVASAIIPGSGQFVQGKDRSVVYAAIEILAWWKLARDWREREREVDEFKGLARRVARAHFVPNGPDGDWFYYEMMRDFEESGVYTKTVGTLDPETDARTYNGYQWQVAQATTTSRPAALVLYQERAFRQDMQWSWRNAGLQFDLFKRSTEKRNDASAAISTDVVILSLNHLISMVDAFAAFRLQAKPLANGRTALSASVRW